LKKVMRNVTFLLIGPYFESRFCETERLENLGVTFIRNKKL
jgi:hypothetical protein